ncbi:MAG: hypothetical protein IKX86_00270, partial [Clostridia bacterium]|nr:hypothetical protein [Clostridia bacterium]
MKKLFAYILIFACLAMLVSCLNEEIHVTDNADENKETNEMIKPVENITNGLNNEDADLVMSSFYCYNYSTFENDINYATDIVKAECVCKTDYAGYTMYDFEVEERFLGDDNVTVLPVRVSKTQYPVVSENGEQLIRMSSIDSEVNYEIGKRYYLILEKYVSVFEENDFYTNVIIKSLIPADDIKSATKYGEPLCNHAAFDFEKSEDSGKDLVIESEKDFANYLFELVKQSAGVERKGSVT